MRAFLLGGLAAAAMQLVVVAPTALAGTYTVYGCRTPSGAPAPLSSWSDSLQVYPG